MEAELCSAFAVIPQTANRYRRRYEHHHPDHSRFAAHWSPPNLALQLGMGVLSFRRTRTGADHPLDSGADGQSVAKVPAGASISAARHRTAVKSKSSSFFERSAVATSPNGSRPIFYSGLRHSSANASKAVCGPSRRQTRRRPSIQRCSRRYRRQPSAPPRGPRMRAGGVVDDHGTFFHAEKRDALSWAM
jgi:hypothetical protein